MSEPDKPEAPPPHATPPPQYGGYPGSYPPPPPQPYPGFTPPPTAPRNGLGVAALVVAIIGLLTVFGGIILGVVAVILGFLGWGRARRGEATNGGVAIAGIVLGFLGILVSIAAIAIAVWGFNEVGGKDYIDCMTKAGSDEQAVQNCADQFQHRVENQFSITITPTP
jgi:Domain of unknown function (DUF4190)